MAATTFPAALAVPRRSLSRTFALYRQGSEIRTAEQDPDSGVRHLHGRVSADVLRAVRHRSGLRQSGKPQRERDLHAGHDGMFRGDGGSAVRLRSQSRHRARPGLVAGEARFAHADRCLLLCQALRRGRVQHGDHAAVADGGHRLRWSAYAGRNRRQTGRHSGRRVDSFQRHGPGDRILRQAELGAGSGQPDLLANVVLLGPVDSAVPAAAWIADACQGIAAVPPQPTGAEHCRHGDESHPGMGTRGSFDRLHAALPWSRSLGIPARRRENVWLKRSKRSILTYCGGGCDDKPDRAMDSVGDRDDGISRAGAERPHQAAGDWPLLRWRSCGMALCPRPVPDDNRYRTSSGTS